MEHDGRLIKAARVYYGITQAGMAKKLKCDQSTISAMEKHKASRVWYGYQGQAHEILKLEDPQSEFVRSVLKTIMG